MFSYYPGYSLLCDDSTQNACGRGECLLNCLACEQALLDPIWASEAARDSRFRVSFRVPLAATFHDIPQMESLLAGYKLLFLFSRYLYLLVEVVIKVSIQSVLVVNLEEDERSICVWLLHLGAKKSTKSSFCAFNRIDVPGKNSSVRRILPTLACLSWRKVETLRSKPALHKRLRYHMQLSYLFA